MRHFLGLLLGVVVTAAILAGAGWAAERAMGQAATPATASGAPLWIALGIMAAVGLIVGLVVAGRVSPLATFVPSLVLLAWTVVYALDVTRAVSLIPDDPTMHELLLRAGAGDRILLTTGVFALLGVLLFIPVLLPSRWVSEREPDEDEGYEESAEQGYY
ncbi:hypothetical protein [Spongiactinospora sp. TRM90649]|uniref:hypothetical protein n=1 Tax=Spongiactinospora sp. TRM90649 TaxID=3031114 RepID=UPI0023F8A26C|nr:hypothetical protein [Spongiactinospora sp. TRM90649]MDF5753912.1 hypothetical protein [Spongiactinospora sp. TRM90649]